MEAKREPIPRALKFLFKLWCFGVLSFIALLLFMLLGYWSRTKLPRHLPSEQSVRQQFLSHRDTYRRAAATLEANACDVQYVYPNGRTEDIAEQIGNQKEYGAVVSATGVRGVELSEDGSIKFIFASFSEARLADSYMGILYVPKVRRPAYSYPPWSVTVVTSLDDAKLPHKDGRVAMGVYMVPIEPEWFVYRFEFQESFF